MNIFYFNCAFFFSFLTLLYAVGSDKLDCLEMEKALTSLETAEDVLSKAENSFLDCYKSDYCGKKPLAVIGISKKLISDVRKNFPNCTGSKVIVQNVKPRDCSEIFESGRIKNGVYTIWPNESNTIGKPLNVYCDMETDGGGWTMIQRRGKFPVQQDFQQDWVIYKNGFGNIKEEFWLGNENIQVLCHEGCEIRFDFVDFNGTKGFAVYQNFNLTGSDYVLYISDYSGDAGDSMQYLNYQVPFSAKDNNTAAEFFKAGWWYTQYGSCNLNGIYETVKTNVRQNEEGADRIYWTTWREEGNLANVEIKVRPK